VREVLIRNELGQPEIVITDVFSLSFSLCLTFFSLSLPLSFLLSLSLSLSLSLFSLTFSRACPPLSFSSRIASSSFPAWFSRLRVPCSEKLNMQFKQQ